jgi:pimeloyl-ACP methyl ester carboxylesterase
LTLLLLLGGCAASSTRLVDVGGHRIWIQIAGKGEPTVVFESGGGGDASAWADIEPEVRRRIGVRTVVYDRAGLGRSDPTTGPYHIDDEARALQRALDRCGVRGPIVLVAHSYGGFVATLVAANDPRVTGVVLVDANLAGFFDAAEVARLLARFTPEFEALERAKPALARVIIPLLRALPETAERMRAVTYPPSLPTVDIVAEQTWVKSPDEIAAMRRAHAAFVAASPAREVVWADRSGHNVMRDRPDVVIDAVARIVWRARGR